VDALSVFEGDLGTRLPDSTLPVIETMSTVGGRRPLAGLARAGQHVEHALGEDVGGQLEAQRGQRRGSRVA